MNHLSRREPQLSAVQSLLLFVLGTVFELSANFPELWKINKTNKNKTFFFFYTVSIDSNYKVRKRCIYAKQELFCLFWNNPEITHCHMFSPSYADISLAVPNHLLKLQKHAIYQHVSWLTSPIAMNKGINIIFRSVQTMSTRHYFPPPLSSSLVHKERKQQHRPSQLDDNTIQELNKYTHPQQKQQFIQP